MSILLAALDLPISCKVSTGTKPVSVSMVYSSGKIGLSTFVGLTGSAKVTVLFRPLSFKDLAVSVLTIFKESALERVELKLPESWEVASSGSYA